MTDRGAAAGEAGKLASRLLVRIGVGLRTDDPFAAANAGALLEAIPRDSWDGLEGTDRTIYSMVGHYATSRWVLARTLLALVAFEEDLGEAAKPVLVLLNRDTALAGFKRGLVHLVADATAGRAAVPLLDEVERAGLELMLVADEEELMPLYGAHFLERDSLPGRLLAASLAAVGDSLFARKIFELPATPGALEAMGELEMRRRLAERVNALGLGAPFCEHLLSLRPVDRPDAEGLLSLCEVMLQMTRWTPPVGQLREVLDHCARSADLPEEVGRVGLADSLAARAIRTACPRAAALWSLQSYATRPSLRSLSRAMHEACSATDQELAVRALAVEPWQEEALNDEDREQFLLGLMRVNGLVGHEAAHRPRIRELAERCVGGANDEEGLRAGAYQQAVSDPGEAASSHMRADVEAAVFNMGLVGFDEEMTDRLPYVEEKDLERVGGKVRFTSPHLTSRAFRAAFEAGIRPHGLLRLADCALEIGDLRHATALISSAREASPRSISVFASLIKLAMHASRQSEQERFAELLADELRANAAAISPTEIAQVLLTVPRWFFAVAPDIAGLALADERLAKHHEDLAARFG